MLTGSDRGTDTVELNDEQKNETKTDKRKTANQKETKEGVEGRTIRNWGN